MKIIMNDGSPIYSNIDEIISLNAENIKLKWHDGSSLIVKKKDIGYIYATSKGGSS